VVGVMHGRFILLGALRLPVRGLAIAERDDRGRRRVRLVHAPDFLLHQHRQRVTVQDG